MENILVLTDFSERARAAAEYAYALAAGIGANITLCHALEITEQLTYPLADQLVLRNQAMKRLKEVGMHLERSFYENDAAGGDRPQISYVNDLDMLTEVATKLVDGGKTDLVVIGCHKSSGLARLFFGSHTNELLDFLNCPVLLVPENVKFKPIEMLAYATDLTFNNTKVIAFLSQFSRPFNAEISVNHITPLDMLVAKHKKSSEYSVIRRMGDENLRLTYKTFVGDNVTQGLLEISDPETISILSLVHKRYDFFEGIFHSSISKQLAQTTKIPLLVMPYSFSIEEEQHPAVLN